MTLSTAKEGIKTLARNRGFLIIEIEELIASKRVYGLRALLSNEGYPLLYKWTYQEPHWKSE